MLRQTVSTQLSHSTAARLWQAIQYRLNQDLATWTQLIEHFAQVAAVERRQAGISWSDNDVFDALLRAVLSNNTDWVKVEHVLPELRDAFCGFSLHRYADTADRDIECRLVSWFKDRKAGSMTLKRGLLGLRQTARILYDWSVAHGSAEDYFLNVIDSANGDPKQASVALGSFGSANKLPALGIPIAAESLRNMGFDICKPDRHICRAVGSFDLVRFRNWPNRDGTKAPVTSTPEMLETMTVVEVLARLVGVRTTFLDTAIWLVCARMGLHLSNAQLMSIAVSDRELEDMHDKITGANARGRS